jgi:hypothetical protein
MNTDRTPQPPRSRARRSIFLGLAVAAALSLGACQAGTNAVPTLPSLAIPSFPPDDMASGPNTCIDAPTMAIIDQLRAAGANVPALLSANKDALIAGLGRLQSSDPTTTAWRDALVGALQSGNMTAAAAEVAKLANGQVTITPC